MTYQITTKSKRFIAYLLDTIIMSILIYLINLLIFLTPAGKGVMETISNMFKNLDSITSSDIEYYIDAISSAMSQILPLVYLARAIVAIIYFVVIPYFWKSQTVGRALTKTRVVSEVNAEKPTIAKLILRDLIGLQLINSVAPIINLIVILLKDRTTGDLMASTNLVDIDSIKEKEVFVNPYEKKNDNDDFYNDVKDAEIYDDIKFKDESSSQKSNDDDDDEYKVF